MMVKFSLVLFLLLNNFYSSSPLVRLPDKTLDYQRLNQPVAAIKHYFPIFQQSLKGKKYYAIESPYTSMSSSHLVEVKVDSARKDIELAEKKLMAKIQNNFRILVFNLFKIGITILIILSIIAYIIYRQKKRASQRRYQTLKLEKEYQILQALIEGEEKERSRIAKDLHDGIAGTLAVIKMNFSTIQQGDPTFQDSSVFKNTLQLLDDVFREVRKTAHNLMPDLLLHYGLDESLNRYCRNISQSNTIHIDYLSIGDIIRLKANFGVRCWGV
ncbi:sensor histidine kinase [Solitalea canadensis]|nr:histidine kinase [Solitalea canadensis]